jgi:DNA polymerase elongation subunit (family B)
MIIAAFDIETVPHQSLPDGVTPEFDPDSVKTGNLKDLEKIQAKEAQARAIFKNGLDKSMSLHPDLCQVACFCGATYDTETTECTTVSYLTERDAIISGWSFIYEAYHHFTPIVSYNGMNFDLPVMLHRAIDLYVSVSGRMYRDLTKRYSTQCHYDLMQILAGWDRQRYESLDFYLKRYGIGTKTGDGSQVYKMWKDGKTKEIEDYCLNDVLLTAKLFSRLEAWIVPGVGVDDA